MTFEQLKIGQYFTIVNCCRPQVLKKISDDYAIYKETEEHNGAVTALKIFKNEEVCHEYSVKELLNDISQLLVNSFFSFHNDRDSYIKVASTIVNLIDDWESNNKD